MNDQLTIEFFDMLPELDKSELYLLVGGARKKYAKDDPTISTSAEVVARGKLTTLKNVHRTLSVVKKIRAQVTESLDKNTKLPFPPQSMTTWIAPNPRHILKAQQLFTGEMNDAIYNIMSRPHEEKSQQEREGLRKLKKLDVLWYSALQKAQGRKLFNIADVDVKDEDIARNIGTELGEHLRWITETPGGYHVVYAPQGNKIVYQDGLKKKYGDVVEWQKDRLTHIWGVSNGGLIVKPLDI